MFPTIQDRIIAGKKFPVRKLPPSLLFKIPETDKPIAIIITPPTASMKDITGPENVPLINGAKKPTIN